MKYIAFVDVLGFKNLVNGKSTEEMVDYLSNYVSCAKDLIVERSELIGFLPVSDSLIIYTKNDSLASLKSLFEYLWQLFRTEFSSNGILLRGGISKGGFAIPRKNGTDDELSMLTGPAYIEAYSLEGTYKASCLTISREVFEDIGEAQFGLSAIKTVDESNSVIAFPIGIDYLLSGGVLKQFVQSAIESSWIPHYYNTLAQSMTGRANTDEGTRLISEIVSIIQQQRGSQAWRALDVFIENAFVCDVDSKFKKRLLRYLRCGISR